MASKKLGALEGLRAIFALIIFFHHIRVFWPEDPLTSTWYYFYSGVTYYFILSGFILTYIYSEKIRIRGQFSNLQFYWKRFIHLYPLHILTLLLSTQVIILDSFTIKKLLLQLFLVQSFMPDQTNYFYFNSLSWFLSDFLLLYLCFPFILKLFLKLSDSSMKRLIIPLILIILYIVVFKTVTKDLNVYYYFYISPYGRIIDFCVGMILSLMYIKSTKLITLSKIWWSTIEILSLIGVCASIYVTPHIPEIFRWDLWFVPIFSLLIFVFALQRGIVSQVLSNRLFVFLGTLSFPFIMFQWIIVSYYFMSYTTMFPLLASVNSFIATMVLSGIYVGTEKLIHYTFESRDE